MKKETTVVDNPKTAEAAAPSSGPRKARRKVYERVREAQIPDDVVEYFKKDNYDLKFIRWCINGTEDYRYLSRRVNEGYEFVTKDELPPGYLQFLRVRDTGSVNGLVTNGGDLCLMKIDADLRKSRQEFYEQRTQDELAAVDLNVTMGRKGYITRGTKSRVTTGKEPTFQD